MYNGDKKNIERLFSLESSEHIYIAIIHPIKFFVCTFNTDAKRDLAHVFLKISSFFISLKCPLHRDSEVSVMQL